MLFYLAALQLVHHGTKEPAAISAATFCGLWPAAENDDVRHYPFQSPLMHSADLFSPLIVCCGRISAAALLCPGCCCRMSAAVSLACCLLSPALSATPTSISGLSIVCIEQASCVSSATCKGTRQDGWYDAGNKCTQHKYLRRCLSAVPQLPRDPCCGFAVEA